MKRLLIGLAAATVMAGAAQAQQTSVRVQLVGLNGAQVRARLQQAALRVCASAADAANIYGDSVDQSCVTNTYE